MSTENDPTMPVPTGGPHPDTEPAGRASATGPAGPTAPIRRSAVGGASPEPPTTPVPRSDAGHTEQLTRPLPATAGAGTQDLGRPVGPAAGSFAASADRPTDQHADLAADRAADPSTDRGGRSADPVAVRAGATDADDAGASRPPMRVGTVVWGLVLAVIGAGIIAVAAGARIDVELAFIVLLALAGTGLVVGSVVTGVRRRH